MGVFEMAKFEVGTKGIMDAVVAATKAGASSIIGKLTFRGLFLAIPNGLKVAQKAVVYIQDTCFNSFANIMIKMSFTLFTSYYSPFYPKLQQE